MTILTPHVVAVNERLSRDEALMLANIRISMG